MLVPTGLRVRATIGTEIPSKTALIGDSLVTEVSYLTIILG